MTTATGGCVMMTRTRQNSAALTSVLARHSSSEGGVGAMTNGAEPDARHGEPSA